MSEHFVDTNICVYAFDNSEPLKKEKAKSVLKERPSISSHVVIQTYLTCFRKLKLPQQVCDGNTRFLCDITSIAPIDSSVFSLALTIKTRYQFSFLDSIVVASALQAGCTILYSEDLQHSQIIEGKLKIVNPFFIV